MRRLEQMFIALCTSVALMASCAKEMQETTRVFSVNWKGIVIKGIQEGGELSKTSVDGITGKVYWSPGDEITVFLGTEGTKYVAQNTEKAATTTFVCPSPVIIGSTEGSGNILYGLYPFDADATSDGSAITTTLPETQKAEEDTFRDSLFITIGKATVSSPTMKFKNVCGGVRFTVATEGITAVTFKGNNDEVLAGKVKISMGSEGVPVVAEVVDGKKEVTLTCTEGFKVGTMYYITTLPANLTKGYAMTFETAGKTGILTTTTQSTIKRSVFGSLDNADADAVWDGIVNIPDANFKAYCVANFDKDGDGEISNSEAESVDSINVYTNDVESMEGLEAFVNLKYLSCVFKFVTYRKTGDIRHYYDANGNEIFGGLSSLDVSNNNMLAYLNCSCNPLTSLDVSKNPELDTLYCWQTFLSSLDVSNNTRLTYIDVRRNKLQSLDVCKNTALTHLGCDDNQLSSLDVKNNTALTFLGCGMNQIASLDVSVNTALTYLGCDCNQLTSLDVRNNTALTFLSCGENQMASLDVSKNTSLTVLYCNGSPYLTEIWLKTGQTINNFIYDTDVATLKYKVDDGGGEAVEFEQL